MRDMIQRAQKGMRFTLTVGVCVLLAACATSSGAPGDDFADDDGDYGYGYEEVADPLEGVNRATLAFNEVVDDALLEPAARGYRDLTPPPVRDGVRNFLRNLRSPVNIANQLLQGDLQGFGNDVARVVLNTTFGVVGLVDVADAVGFSYEKEDFGQTLGTWGVGHGAYLVLPLMGPSSVRDGTGMLVDSYADPVRLYLFNTDREGWYYARAGVSALVQREELLDVLDDLQKNSFDYYAALRSVYIQRREAETSDRDGAGDGAVTAMVEMPDYDDEEWAYD